MTRPPLSAPPASSATVPVPWSVPSVPLMRAVRPNSVMTATTVSRQDVAHVGLDRGERAVERAQQVGELTRRRAFVDVRIPADEAHGADAGAVRPRQISSGRAGGVREVGPHARDARRRKLRGVRRRIASIPPARASAARRMRPSSARASLGSVWR